MTKLALATLWLLEQSAFELLGLIGVKKVWGTLRATSLLVWECTWAASLFECKVTKTSQNINSVVQID